MAWHGGRRWYGGPRWDYYPPYVSVAQKKADGALALAKLLKRSKRAPEPVVAPRKRQLAADLLEGGADLLLTEMNDDELLRLVALDMHKALQEI